MKDYFRALNILSETELEMITPFIQHQTMQKGQTLLHLDTVCHKLYYIKSGVLRSYYWNYDSDQVTSCIAFDNEFMTSFPSFIQQQKSKEVIHALQNTIVEYITHADLESLYDSCINWSKLGRKLVEHQYVIMDQHVTEFQKQKSSFRYEFLLKHYPFQVNQIPQHYIASYLGISTRQLTRIRKSLL